MNPSEFDFIWRKLKRKLQSRTKDICDIWGFLILYFISKLEYLIPVLSIYSIQTKYVKWKENSLVRIANFVKNRQNNVIQLFLCLWTKAVFVWPEFCWQTAVVNVEKCGKIVKRIFIFVSFTVFNFYSILSNFKAYLFTVHILDIHTTIVLGQTQMGTMLKSKQILIRCVVRAYFRIL